MIEKYCSPSRHASRSNDAISSLQGPHQLAQTLMISGLPRNSLNFRDGPFSPRSVASRSVPPIGTSPEVFAIAAGFATARHSKKTHRHRSIMGLYSPASGWNRRRIEPRLLVEVFTAPE